MSRKIKILLLSTVFIGLLYNIIWYTTVYYFKNKAKKLYNIVKTHRRVYAYETFYGVINYSVYIKNLNDSSTLINYYNYAARRIDTGLDFIRD